MASNKEWVLIHPEALNLTRADFTHKQHDQELAATLAAQGCYQIEPRIELIFFRNFGPNGGRAPMIGNTSIMVWL